jgi:hypothetical protein
VYQPKFAGFVFYGTSCEPLFVTQANQSNASQWKTSIGANDIATDSWVDGRSNQSQVGAGAAYIADPNTSPAFKLCEELTYGGFWRLVFAGRAGITGFASKRSGHRQFPGC